MKWLLVFVFSLLDYYFANGDRCEPITSWMCHSRHAGISYNQTIMPNVLGHRTQRVASLEMRMFKPLLDAQCNEPDLRQFLCTVYFPVCTLPDAIPPCQSLCLRARKGCAEFNDQFVWPSYLDCDRFPSSGLCVDDNQAEGAIRSGEHNAELEEDPKGDESMETIQKCGDKTFPGFVSGEEFEPAKHCQSLDPFKECLESGRKNTRSGNLGSNIDAILEALEVYHDRCNDFYDDGNPYGAVKDDGDEWVKKLCEQSGNCSLEEQTTASVQGRSQDGDRQHSQYSRFNDMMTSQIRSEASKGQPGKGQPLDVEVSLRLVSLSNVNKEDNQITMVFWKSTSWKVPSLKWDQRRYNFSTFHTDTNSLWTPDTMVYQAVKRPSLISPDIDNLIVFPDGSVVHVPAVEMTISCDVRGVDTYSGATCQFKLGSWAHSTEDIKIAKPTESSFSVEEFFSTSRYEVMRHDVSLESKSYPQYGPGEYQHMVFSMTFREKYGAQTAAPRKSNRRTRSAKMEE